MIEFRQVSASYDGELAILRDVSFTVSDGDFVAFVGTNGAGKSTTMPFEADVGRGCYRRGADLAAEDE